MAFNASADANRVALRYVKEVTPGVTPATPEMQEIRFTGESLNASRSSESSKEIRSDRNIADLITTAESAGGDINIELSANSYDDFLASAFQGSWTANALVNGTTRSSYTLEKHFQDVNKLEVYTGAEVTGFKLDMKTGSFVTGGFTFMARGVTDATTMLDSTPTAAPTTPVFNLTNDMSSFTIGGTAYGDGVQSFSLTVNNNAREQRQIGSKFLAGVGMGTFELSGSMQAYFGNATAILDAYKNETYVPIQFVLTKGGKSYTVLIPKVKFGSKTTVAGGINTDVELSLTWQAIYDATIGGTCKITRVA